MRTVVGFAFAVLIMSTGAFGQDAAKDAKLLEGAWLPSAAELGGQSFDDKTLKLMKLVVEGDKYTVTVGDQIDRGAVKLDPSKNPKAMDILGGDGPNKGRTFLAIYELKGDTLRVCYDLTGKTRPTEFKSQKGTFTFFVTYQRGQR